MTNIESIAVGDRVRLVTPHLEEKRVGAVTRIKEGAVTLDDGVTYFYPWLDRKITVLEDEPAIYTAEHSMQADFMADEPLADWEKELLAGKPFDMVVDDLFREAAELLKSKHRDYGPKNISLSPGGPMNGLRVRMHDKLARLNHLTDKATEAAGDDYDPTPHHESLEDTLVDLANYALIGVLVLREQWPA